MQRLNPFGGAPPSPMAVYFESDCGYPEPAAAIEVDWSTIEMHPSELGIALSDGSGRGADWGSNENNDRKSLASLGYADTATDQAMVGRAHPQRWLFRRRECRDGVHARFRHFYFVAT